MITVTFGGEPQHSIATHRRARCRINAVALGAPHFTVWDFLFEYPRDAVFNVVPPDELLRPACVYDALRYAAPDVAENYGDKACRDVLRNLPNGWDVATLKKYAPHLLPNESLDWSEFFRLNWLLPAPREAKSQWLVHPQFNRKLTIAETQAIYAEWNTYANAQAWVASQAIGGEREYVYRFDPYTTGGHYFTEEAEGYDLRNFDLSQLWPRCYTPAEDIPIAAHVTPHPFEVPFRKGDKYAKRR